MYIYRERDGERFLLYFFTLNSDGRFWIGKVKMPHNCQTYVSQDFKE